MYFLHLDESGDTGEFRKRNSRYYVLAGLASKPESYREIALSLKKIKEDFFEDMESQPDEIKYRDVIHRKFPYNKIDGKAFSDQIFDLILNSDFTLFAVVVDKVKHWRQYVNPLPPDELGLEYMTERFQWFLERNEDIGLIVYDEMGGSIHRNLLKLFERFKKIGTDYKRPRRVIETIFFTPSETSVLLQLADFCAYSVFSRYEHGKDERFKLIESKFNKFGLKEFP